ncbi:unnamed protein product [Boreogadus saida]
MRCYRLPGFQSRLLLELQRQQHNKLFCDTLLQTEGVSIPAHGCLLAALSPYLSRKLSASPHPPAGQQRKVKLQTVNAETLLKLVGLLYSGQLELNESTDQDDVLAAANNLVFDRLLEGPGELSVGGGGVAGAGAGQAIGGEASQLAEERKDGKKRVACDAEVQVEMRWCRRDAETQIEGTGSVDAETQIEGTGSVDAASQTDVSPSWSSRDNASLHGELGPGSPAALLDETGLSQEVTKTTTSTAATTTKSPRNSRVSSEVSRCNRPKPGSLKRNRLRLGSREAAGCGGKKEPSGGQSTQTKGKEMRKLRGRIGGGCWSPRRLSALTREIAIKVKLRRVEQGAAWEVVNMRDICQRRRSRVMFAALKKDRAKLLRTQAEGTKGPSIASTSQPSPVTKQHQSPCMSLALTVQPPCIEVFTDLQSPSSPCCTPSSNDSMTALLSQAHGSVEESDQDIEKLLEDIMMGLNILPSSGLEKDGNGSSFKSNGAAIPSAPPALEWTERQGEVDTDASEVGSQWYKTLWEDASSEDAVLYSRSSSYLVPAVASTSSVHCAETWPQTEHQSNQIAQAQSSLAEEQPASKDSLPDEGFAQCHSLNHRGQGDTTDQSALRSEPLDYQDLHTLNVASIAPDTVNSDSQQTEQPPSKELTWMSSTQHVLQFPLSLGSKQETKPSDPDDPSRLESLEDLELLPSLRQSTEVKQEKRKPPVKKLCVEAAKEKMQSSDGEGLTGAISPFGKAPKKKDPPLEQCDTKDKPVTSKRKRIREAHTDDASDRTSGYKVTRHGAGEFSQIFLNVCSVNLSGNNVLSKRRILKQEPPVFKEPQKVLDTTGADKGYEKLKADKGYEKLKADKGYEKLKADNGYEKLKAGKGYEKLKAGKGYEKLKAGKGYEKLKADKGYEKLKADKGYEKLKADKGYEKLKADKTITETRKISTPRARSASTTKDKADEIVETVPVIKKKLGRPRKIVPMPHNANPSVDKILESDRKTNAQAEIGEQCEQNERKLRRKCKEIVQDVQISKCGQSKGKPSRKGRKDVRNVQISNDEVHYDVPSSDPVSAPEPPRVADEQLCAQPHDPSESEPNEHRAGSENTRTEEAKMTGNPESRVNPAVTPKKAKRTPTDAPEPPRVADEQLCAQPHDPSESEPNEHRAGSENTRTEEAKMTGNPESRVNPAVTPKKAKRTPTVSLKQFKQLIKFRQITIRGAKTKTKVISSEVEENVHSDGKVCENTDRCEATSSDISPTKNVNDVKFDQNHNLVITTESLKSKVDVTVSQDKRWNHSQGQKGNQVPLEAEDKKGKDYNRVDVDVKASPIVCPSSSIASKAGDQCIAKHPGHSAASKTSGKPETIPPRPTVEPVTGLKKSDHERRVEADDLSSKDFGFHSHRGEEETSEVEIEETSEVEIEEMGEALLDGEERLVERPDEASDSANSTETPQAPVEDSTPCWVRPSQQSNAPTTDCPLTSEPQNRSSRDIEGSRHSQEDEEDMEVDILLCSPGRGPMEFGGRVIVDSSQDEDDEELKEIDVMGI